MSMGKRGTLTYGQIVESLKLDRIGFFIMLIKPNGYLSAVFGSAASQVIFLRRLYQFMVELVGTEMQRLLDCHELRKPKDSISKRPIHYV